MISANLSAIFYLVSGILFILALRGLSSPDTSRQGNYFGIAGMIIAIVVTFLSIGNFSTSLVYVMLFISFVCNTLLAISKSKSLLGATDPSKSYGESLEDEIAIIIQNLYRLNSI